MATDARAVEGGLADPVFAAQAIFRRIMEAFAAPGSVVEIGAAVSAPPSLAPAAAALLAALADGDTPVWLAASTGEDEAAARWLRFQTGAPVTGDASSAAFAVLPDGDDPAGWDRFPVGTPDYPDRSATLLLPVRALAGGAALRLAGPGIETERRVAPAGLPAGFGAAREANRARFPLGHDLVLVCGTAAMALPRTTRIREA